MSSFLASNPFFYRTRNQPFETSLLDGSQQRNLLMDKILKQVNRADDFIFHNYIEGEHITTISYRYYRTTTLWWAILAYNGFIHPLEIEEGFKLKIPNLNQLNNVFDSQTAQTQTNRNRSVVI